jgi:hypothetical protein
MPDKVLYTATATATGDRRGGPPGVPYSRATRGNISIELRVP